MRMLESERRPIRSDAFHSPIRRGSSSPLGARPGPDGTNFSVFSKHATGVELLLFDRVDDAHAARVIRIDPAANRTYHYWHVFVSAVKPGQLYGYRVQGPRDPANGMRFDPTKVLLDPYGRGVAVPDGYSRGAAIEPGDNSATAMKSVVVDPSVYDWEGDAPLRQPSALVLEACRDPIDQADRSVGVPQQQSAGIRGHRSTIECRHYPPLAKAFKLELLGATLCLHRTPCANLASVCPKNTIPDSRGRCTSHREISGLT